MTGRDFAYWLQGAFELADLKTLNEKQTDLVRRHLNMVFEHEIDPSFGEDLEKLKEIHTPTPVKQQTKCAHCGGNLKGNDTYCSDDCVVAAAQIKPKVAVKETIRPTGRFREPRYTC